jgi:2-polyprenyl-6-hydroxyphenyl methylase/3-demethylubiquinone-9 3-methyltransferase
MKVTAAEPLFDRGGWWDESQRDFASLRSVTAFRLELLRRWLPDGCTGRTVVDLGCGAGLLAVPLAGEGARVVGVDLARRALAAGREQSDRWLPVAGDLSAAPLANACADAVLLADVVEHLADPAAAVREAARLLRAGGHLFVNTIHRTVRSRLLAITLGEGLGFVPRGTHRWSSFVTPAELDAMAAAEGLALVARTGEAPRLLRTLAARAVVLRESRSLAVGYASLYRRIPR